MVNIDSKLPNIALHKIEKYYLDKGDSVTWDDKFSIQFSDKIYVSCIFTKNKQECKFYEGIADIGGTGYDVHKKLPEEIERIPLRINYGFTLRGCIRKCEFCLVHRAEGNIRVVGDLYDIWDGKSKEVTFLDNNILALPEHFKKICEQLQKEKLKGDFNQGLDVRLLTDDLAEVIKKTKLQNVRFAYDNTNLKNTIENKMKVLDKYNIHAMWYVLAGFKSDFADALSRVQFLIKNKQRAYLMRHEDVEKDRRYTALARWCNSPIFGKGTIPFKKYLNESEDGGHYVKYFTKDEMKLWKN